jgi:hypothetical protein
VKDNIRMMRLVFNSTRTDNDTHYEATLLPDLQWLIRTIEKEGVPEWWDLDLAGEMEENPDYTALHHIKILRRTILLGIIPHFEQSGKAFKSMAYLNLYEELLTDENTKKVRDYARKGMLREGVSSYGSTVYFHPPIYREERLIMYDYYDYNSEDDVTTVLVVDSVTGMRSFDYSTLLFAYMDTTSIANVQQYVQFLRSGGKTAAEKFVLRHSYRDLSFYNELIATKFMRLEQYDSALVYLRKVSPDFPSKQNIAEYIGTEHRNPFAEGWINLKQNKANFGLPFNPAAEYDKNPGKAAFCKLMLRLRKMTETDPSEEIRAKAAYAYAVGLFRSTIGNAWALCFYEYGWHYTYIYGDATLSYTQSVDEDVHHRVDGWLNKALQYDGDHVFTTKCKVLHSREQEKLKREVKRSYTYGNYTETYTEKEFIPEVRGMFCDQGCDYERDPFCTDEWRECAWYY